MIKLHFLILLFGIITNLHTMEKREDIDKANSELVDAAAAGNQEKAELLMAQGANHHAFNGLALIAATRNKKTHIINLFFRHDEFEKNKALKIAAADGDHELTRMFMQAGADPDDEHGEALYLAAKNGHTKIVEFLTQEPRTEASIARAIDGALEGKQEEIYQTLGLLRPHPRFVYSHHHLKPSPEPLFQGPIEIERHDPVPTHLRTPFLKAASTRNYQQVHDLFVQAASFPLREQNDALFYAAGNGDNVMVELLINAGFDVHGAGDCALKAACDNNHPETARLLLQKGADVHTNFEEPLCIARRNRFKALEDCLLSLGADSNAVEVWRSDPDPTRDKPHEGRCQRIFQRPLQCPIANTPSLIDRILGQSYRIPYDHDKVMQEIAHATTAKRIEILITAVSNYDDNMMRALLTAAGADEETIHNTIQQIRSRKRCQLGIAHLFGHDTHGPKTPVEIHQAIADGQMDTNLWHALVDGNLCDEIAFVVKSGGNVNSYHGLALKLAVDKNQADMVRTLLTHHADVHVDNDAPLRLAAAQGNEAMVAQLLAAGANAHAYSPEFPDRDRFMIPSSFNIFDPFYQFDRFNGPQAPLRLAAFYGNDACFRLLLGQGANATACANQILWNAAHGGSESIARYILENRMIKIDACNEVVIVEAAGSSVNYNGAEAEHTRNEDDQKRAALVSLLLRHGARATAGDGAAFRAAARCGFIRTLQVLSKSAPEFIESHAQEYIHELEQREKKQEDRILRQLKKIEKKSQIRFQAHYDERTSLQLLKKTEYKPAHEETLKFLQDTRICPICLDPLRLDAITLCSDRFKDGSKKHAFHTLCLETWLLNGHRTCPYCKRPTK